MMRTLTSKLGPATAVAATIAVATLGATTTPSGASTAPTAAGSSAVAAPETPPLSAEQEAHLTSVAPDALSEIETAMTRHGSDEMSAQAFPIAAVAIAAAAWCARGALASIPTSVLADIANGGAPTNYVENAIIGCLVGEVGGVVWKFVPGWAKKKAVEMVASFVIRFTRS